VSDVSYVSAYVLCVNGCVCVCVYVCVCVGGFVLSHFAY
jgi:hypothetical protein